MILASIFALASFAHAAEPTLAGLPAATFGALGLGEPDYLVEMDAWQAPAPGGWVRHFWSVDVATAQADFRFQRAAVAQVGLPALVVAGADEAVGGTELVVARRANVVIVVKGAGAPERAAELLAAELPEGSAVPAPASAVDPAGVVRDAFGRRVAR